MPHSILPLPYHKRAPRLRWASLAIDLPNHELHALQLVAGDESQPERTRGKARMLIGLHKRVPIHDLCEELHMDRRALFRIASELAKPLARRSFLNEVVAA